MIFEWTWVVFEKCVIIRAKQKVVRAKDFNWAVLRNWPVLWSALEEDFSSAFLPSQKKKSHTFEQNLSFLVIFSIFRVCLCSVWKDWKRSVIFLKIWRCNSGARKCQNQDFNENLGVCSEVLEHFSFTSLRDFSWFHSMQKKWLCHLPNFSQGIHLKLLW